MEVNIKDLVLDLSKEYGVHMCKASRDVKEQEMLLHRDRYIRGECRFSDSFFASAVGHVSRLYKLKYKSEIRSPSYNK